ncbi:TetR/AcrR family transcriptional regulator [Actinoalloteichus sp. AHMU CJ021]|uniref:Transcriptional regulator, TetR family n=2 Tax=Actinoalloteichus TaxID=65496 RepID=A0ABT1JF00_ACTCY|nr:TetR/AcrR family transcriptional regulator [Actinoalloteichus caeruleus]AUS81347.1 TetR/AcrR family transcriptional regulator [Actinoalloteichus sp. AHMU CJ021]MCP2330748.1 transcriptional regulator, TetR family [Actinoalloteichus caeruleus DSM 43889]
MSPQRPLRADAARNRARIMATAHEQITEHGAGVSMERIAAASGVAVGTLYKHFPNKTDLVNAVIAASFAPVADDAEDSLRRAGQGAPAMEELTGFLTRLMDTVAHNQAVKAAAHALNTDHAVHPAMRDLEARVTSALGQLLRAAQAQGELRTDCTVDDLYLVLSTFPTDQAPAARVRWLALVLTGLIAR